MDLLDYITALKLIYPYARRILIDNTPMSASYRIQILDTDNTSAVTDNGAAYITEPYHTITTIIDPVLSSIDWKYEVGSEVVINARTWSNPYKDNYISIVCNKAQSSPMMMDFTIKVCNK